MDSRTLSEVITGLWPAGSLVATTDQLLAAGFTTRLLEAGLRRGVLQRLRRGIYVLAKALQDKPPWIKDKLALLGHVVLSQGQPLYSHFSAARLHRLQLWNISPTIHLSSAHNASAVKLPRDVVAHKMEVPASQRVQQYVKGVGLARFTSLARTVLDCATAAPLVPAVVIGDSALSKGLSLNVLEDALAEAAGRKGIRAARRAVAAMNPLSESAGETRTRLIIAELPIEQPELQVWVESGCGRFRVDFLWRKRKLILEFDGDIKYFNFGMPTEQALIQERERENALIEEGWRFIRIKWAHLNQPDILKARIMRVYFSQGVPANTHGR